MNSRELSVGQRVTNESTERMSRRRFLHAAAVGLAGAALPAHRLSARNADVTTGTGKAAPSTVCEIAAVRYAPPGRYMKDHCFVRRNNRWHLFAPLGKMGASWEDPGSEETAEHMVSDDLQQWEHLGTAVDASRQDGYFDKMMGGIAPHVIEHHGKFWCSTPVGPSPASGRMNRAASKKQFPISFCDRTGLEVFASDGLTYVPMPFIPKADDLNPGVQAKGGSAKFALLNVYDLRSIWK